jgi:hypothetical protein
MPKCRLGVLETVLLGRSLDRFNLDFRVQHLKMGDLKFKSWKMTQEIGDALTYGATRQ